MLLAIHASLYDLDSCSFGCACPEPTLSKFPSLHLPFYTQCPPLGSALFPFCVSMKVIVMTITVFLVNASSSVGLYIEFYRLQMTGLRYFDIDQTLLYVDQSDRLP